MVFRKYRPVKQWGKMDTRIFKEILNSRNNRKMPAFKLPEAVQALGVPIFDPNDPNFPQCLDAAKRGVISAPETKPPVYQQQGIEDHPLYKAIHCFLFDGSDPMSDGMAQACALSKAVLREGFPRKIMDGYQLEVSEEKVHDAILHGEKYDPTLEKLPERFDPIMFWIKHVRVHGTPVVKRNNIILDNLYRHALFAAIANGLSADSHRSDRDEPISAIVGSSPDFSLNPLVLRYQPHLTVQNIRSIPLWADEQEVNSTSDEVILDVAPLSPTIDLGRDNVYNDGALIARQSSNLYVDTLLWAREQDQKYPWTTEQNAANAILHTFGAAVAQASRSQVTTSGDLKKPVLTKGVQLCDGKLDLVAFQLNTLDLNPKNPIKNIAWVERAVRLYTPKPYYEQMTSVDGVNMEAFKKFAALLLS